MQSFLNLTDAAFAWLSWLKRYLKLNVGSEAHFLLQSVMIYNTIIWFFYLLQFRRHYRRRIFAKKNPSLSQELSSLSGKYNPRDTDYRELSRLYRLYVFFLIFLIATTTLLLHPQTWIVPITRLLLPAYALTSPSI